VPGQILGLASEYLPGPGVHVHNAQLYASILGPVLKSTPPKPTGPQKRLTKITPAALRGLHLLRMAGRERRTFCQRIRVQDVRATEKDKVKIFESFRPGDIVRANVISLGDQANYYLSTATNNLGVIMATSEAGNAMYPVSWKEYKDPETGASESRKVAKPF
ncbi:hypothetical protein BUE80_DR013925, partial [Diplocarpon rosae]